MIETYNLHVSSPCTPHLLESYNSVENLVYHLLNAFAAGRSGNVAFLRQKYSVETRRLRVRANIAMSAAAAALGLPGAVTYHHRRIDEANEAAHHTYTPRPYPGRIVLFRPKTHYTGYRDPLFGWGAVAQGGVDVHTLPVHPRGMLVRPFVQELAREFQRALRDGGHGSPDA